MTQRSTPQTPSRDLFLYWWPVTARFLGGIGGLTYAAYALVTHQQPDAGVLAFCGALILVPVAFDAQAKSNRSRGTE